MAAFVDLATNTADAVAAEQPRDEPLLWELRGRKFAGYGSKERIPSNDKHVVTNHFAQNNCSRYF